MSLWLFTSLSLSLALAVSGLACSGGAQTSPDDKKPGSDPADGAIVPVDVPTTGFNYPGDRDQIQAWADQWDIRRITAQSWNLWAGMTSGSGQRFAGDELPVWETWCGTAETFGKTCNTMTRPPRDFLRASQHTHSPAGSDPGDLRLVAFNKYNPAMSDYLAAMHPGPGDAEIVYDYTQQQSLSDLNAAWPAGTSIADRKVEETPYIPGKAAAIELKPVMYAVKATQLTAVPLWRGPQDSTVATNPVTGNDCTGVIDNTSPNAAKCHPDPTTWLTCVIVDPGQPEAPPSTAPVPATAEQIAAAEKGATPACTSYLYAPLGTLYHSEMNAAEAASFNSVQGGSGVTAAAGDFAVLMAMHINTKAIINWTWQTMWWQPGDDTVNAFPGSKQAMTDNVKDEWRNYAMCTAYNQTQGNASDTIQVCFNPFLETSTGIPDGLQSNCMSCHGTATVGTIENGSLPTLSYPESYTQPIDFTKDPRFAPFTRTDFSWAIPVNSKPVSSAD